jgi:hypothetical protein
VRKRFIKTHDLVVQLVDLGSDDLELTGSAGQGLLGVHANGGDVIVVIAINKESFRLLGELGVLFIKGTLMHSLSATDMKQGDYQERYAQLHGGQYILSFFC